MKFAAAVICAIYLASHSIAAPAASGTASPVASTVWASAPPAVSSARWMQSTTAPGPVYSATPSSSDSSEVPATFSFTALPAYETVPLASDDPNDVIWSPSWDANPKPMRGSLGSDVIGPQNVPMDLENPDLLAPPTTDAGTVYVHTSKSF